MPKDTIGRSTEFYQTEYEQGFTTDLPGDEELNDLLNREFKDREKDYTPYIEVLRAIGLKTGDSILDSGCSWGYGSWQLRQAGFHVFSYEVDPRRSDFARARLGCLVVENEMPYKSVDCLFSAHVLEHLPDPNVLWRFAQQVLRLDDTATLLLSIPRGIRATHRSDANT